MPQYRQFQRTAYRPEMSAYWYFDRWPYLKFMLREASSIFVGWFAVVILLQLNALISGPRAYENFQRWMATPAVFIVNLICFVFVCFHAITWFMLVPRVMARQVLERPTPDMMSAAPNFGIWLVASVIVALFALRVI
ncbi:MAG: fumarate reductase subunit C [Deltaproteobacteria bacterium]|nr:fumarate reductase subunit C [Deltaproteobacteria bacterium]